MGAVLIFEKAQVSVLVLFVGFVFPFFGHGALELSHQAFEIAVVRNDFLGAFYLEGLGVQEQVKFFFGIVLDLLVGVDNFEFDQLIPQEAAGFVVDMQDAAIAD